MTLVVIPVPVAQWFTDAGAPNAGGKVYTYEAQSTTPLVTYNNADGAPGHENTNPVILDASGRAIIYLTSALYKIDVQTAAGVSLAGYPQDNIAGSLWTGNVVGDTTLSPAINASGYANQLDATINKAGSGTHPVFATLALDAPTIGAGAATLTEAATLYIAGPPSGGSSNYAQHVASGLSKLDGSVQAPFDLTSASSVLSVTSNVITPTGRVHHVGAGLIKTITVPAVVTAPTVIHLVPDAAFTYDATGNIGAVIGGVATIGRTMDFTWDGTKWWASY